LLLSPRALRIPKERLSLGAQWRILARWFFVKNLLWVTYHGHIISRDGGEARRRNNWWQIWHNVCSGAQVPWQVYMNTAALSLETNPLSASQLPAPRCTNHYDKSDIIQKRYESQVFWCFAATQLALPVHQERTQVVCSNKEARKRLAEALPPWTMDFIASAYTCTQIKEKQNKTLIKKHETRMKNTQRETRIHFYRISYFWIVSVYISLFI